MLRVESDGDETDIVPAGAPFELPLKVCQASSLRRSGATASENEIRDPGFPQQLVGPERLGEVVGQGKLGQRVQNRRLVFLWLSPASVP